MSGRHITRYFSTMYQNKVSVPGIVFSDFPAGIEIDGNEILFRSIFKMVRNSNCVQSVSQCFIDPYGGPYIAIREDCVQVKITFKGYITRQIRKIYNFSLPETSQPDSNT